MKRECNYMNKLTYEKQLTISFFIVILGCILSDIFNFWIYHSIAYIICGLLFIVHPVVPKNLEGIEKAVFWARIAGVILILIGIFSRVDF